MDLDELKKKKLRELQAQMKQAKEDEEKKKQLEMQKKRLLKKILTPEARSRLSNLRVAKPQFVERIELQLIQLARTGRVNLPIDDEQLRKILRQLQKSKKTFKIKRK
ncbi:hypothetical protein AKJ44_00565 [candidate division MSBL1 archaeon SCGC-AAA261F17]|uniref:DNA-binding protein AKJ44_00565 n=1 Tax=candidate division MSBL1 archaeon SCGC-AAA261F17 TaxID=1698274 RepID=A0A133V7J6_9EURY|nr:hypothetical protein AKJ44_00565 [candidate division MSBL1 archaeon SCGC-AAA261F17]